MCAWAGGYKSNPLTNVHRADLFDEVIELFITLLSHIEVVAIVEQVVVLATLGWGAIGAVALTEPKTAPLLMNDLHC